MYIKVILYMSYRFKCYDGAVKTFIGFWIDIFVCARIIVAAIMKERNINWIFYSVFLLTSPIWINLLVEFLK